MTELKDCPFCGGPAETDSQRAYRSLSTGRVGHAVAVYCTGSCSADMSLCREDVPELSAEDALAALIENWNRRLPLQQEESREAKALRNCLLLTMRMLSAGMHKGTYCGDPHWEDMLRLCKEGGVEPSPLRDQKPAHERELPHCSSCSCGKSCICADFQGTNIHCPQHGTQPYE